MSDTLLLPVGVLPRASGGADAIALRLQRGAGELAGRLAEALGATHPAYGFLADLADAAARAAGAPDPAPQPIDRLVAALGLGPAEIDLLVLAALPEEHEGLAAVLRDLHPAGRPLPTTGLAAALAEAGLLPGLGSGPTARRGLRRLLTDASLVRAGAVHVPPGGGFWERDLVLADGLWSAVHGEPGWPAGVLPLPVPDGGTGLLLPTPADPAVRAVAAGEPVVVTVAADDAEQAAVAAARLVGRSGARVVPLRCAGGALGPAWLAAAASGLTPVFVPDAAEEDLVLPDVPGPVVVAARPSQLARLTRAALALEIHQPGHRDATVPDGGTRVLPSAGWADLVLPDPARAQLEEAVARVRHGDVVLDRWRFLDGRPGRRGLRLLFSGPPGTGKTLAAEVLAGAIGRELLVVDLSRTVSKWIGETEKNLAAAFDAAERGDYVLLFDEADALFARRTEVGDARDRYANLETSYLLSRLSWFEGVAVLATNLRQNLDVAFGRRLEFVVPFDLPDGAQRRRLWRVHLPPTAPLGPDVDLDQVADFYPITGALIRNAALAAAYLAADAGTPIGADHLSRAIHREHLKAGLAYPGRLPESSPSPKESPCP